MGTKETVKETYGPAECQGDRNMVAGMPSAICKVCKKLIIYPEDFGKDSGGNFWHYPTCPSALGRPFGLGESGTPTGIRKFATGATRDVDTNKYDYEGFLSPLVIERYGRYMHQHRVQSDGSLRDSDNWQRGITKTSYIKSAWRHFRDLWAIHRGYGPVDDKGNHVTLEDALCAIMFNAMGYLHEVLTEKLLSRTVGQL